MAHRQKFHVLATVLLGATALAGIPSLALAQSAPAERSSSGDRESQDPAEAQDTRVDEIVVTGFRQSYANAIASKRNEDSITDGISSDGLGRFPDLNVGEALQRVPGVQINREAEGRNATINLRGLPGEFSRLTLNGVAFAEPILRESAPLGAFNSDIFSAIVVNKSPLADAQSGGLSGNVDLRIAPALGRMDGGFMKVASEYNELGETWSPAATIGYNHHFSDDFAVFGTLAYRHEDFRRDTILFNSYAAFTPAQAEVNPALRPYYAASAACPSCTGSSSTAGVLYDAQHRQYVRLNEGDLVTGAIGAEYRLNDQTRIGITGFYSDRDLPMTTQYLLITSNNQSSILTANSDPVLMSDGRYVVEDFSFANADITSSTRGFSQTQRVWGVNLNGEWQGNNGWTVSGTAALSRAENDSIEISVDFETLQTAAGNGITGRIVTGGDNLDNHVQQLGPYPAVTTAGISTGVWGGVTSSGAWYDSATPALRTNRFNFQGTQTMGTNEAETARIDIERELFDGGFLSGFQFGAVYESVKYTAEGYRIMAYGLPIQNVTSDFLVTAPFASDFFNGQGGQPTDNWQVVDLDRAITALQPVTVYPGAELSPSGYNINYANNAYARDNFTNGTDVLSAYGQVKYDFDVGTMPVHGNIGLRYESADNTVDALTRVTVTNNIGAPSDFVPQRYEQSYDKWLPSFIVIAEPREDVVLRAAAYQSYVRPQPLQFSPSTVVSAPSTGGVYTVTLGNPELEPYDATSFDFSAEWYNRRDSIISLALFTKRITGLIGPITDPNVLCPADGGGLGIGTFTISGDQCLSSLTYTQGGVTQPYQVVVSGYTNQDNPITVSGAEFNLQQSFDFLPGFWSNLGGGFNYAYTTVSGTTTSDDDATLPGVSEHNLNVIGYYETERYGIRLVYNLRSEYDLASTASFTGAARQVRSRGQIDLSASYNISDTISLGLDAYNLTDEIRVEYENQENMPRRADYDGRTVTMTLRATF
jgi:TonB-dependent receptor